MGGIVINLVFAVLNGYLAVSYGKTGKTSSMVIHTAIAGFCAGLAFAGALVFLFLLR